MLLATYLSHSSIKCQTPLLSQIIERQATEATGNKLDAYDMEVPAENSDALKDLAEFHLAMVRSTLNFDENFLGV